MKSGKNGNKAEFEIEEELRQCKVLGCDRLYFAKGYCRLHYIKYWKRIKIKERLMSESLMDDHAHSLIDQYPDEFIDQLREDIKRYEDLDEEDVEGIIDEFLNQENDEE